MVRCGRQGSGRENWQCQSLVEPAIFGPIRSSKYFTAINDRATPSSDTDCQALHTKFMMSCCKGFFRYSVCVSRRKPHCGFSATQTAMHSQIQEATYKKKCMRHLCSYVHEALFRVRVAFIKTCLRLSISASCFYMAG